MTQPSLVARIKARCIEDGGCLLWQGMTTPAGMPKLDRTRTARRALWEAEHGEPVPQGMLLTPTCGHKLCMRHLEPMTPKDSKAVAAARGAYKSAARVRKRVQTVRARSRYSEEVVEAIRQAETPQEASERFGVSLPYAYAIRSGQARAPLTTPFAGLGARNA